MLKSRCALTSTALVALIGCGQTTVSNQKTVADASMSLASVYTCTDAYADTSVQDTPLWTETFDADLAAGELPLHPFGVTPGDSYAAWVGTNQPDGFALAIYNMTTGQASAAVYERGTRSAMLTVNVSEFQTLSLGCSLVPQS